MRVFVLLVSLIGVVAMCANAQVPPGIGSAAFARLGVDARAIGMGGAFAAVASGGPIAFYNPASLALAREVDVAALYAAPYGADLGISYQHVSAVLPLSVQTESKRGLGVAVTWMGVQISDIMVWDESDPGSGTSFTATDSIYLASLGVELLDGICVGGAAKLYQARILNGRGEGVGFDLGLIASFRLGEIPISVGLNSTDVGRTTVKWSGTTGNPDNFVPWVNKLGVAVRLDELSLLAAAAFDWGAGRPKREQMLRAGFEWSPVEVLALRGGGTMTLEGTTGITAGVGLRLFGLLSFDYAYVSGTGLGGTHFGSFHVSF
jgi:hypothetical protein